MHPPETQKTVILVPSCGIFMATDNRAKKHHAYDAQILYDAKHNIINKNSSIQKEWLDLKRCYALYFVDTGQSVSLPSLPQFATHYHRFIQSQVVIHKHAHVYALCTFCCVSSKQTHMQT